MKTFENLSRNKKVLRGSQTWELWQFFTSFFFLFPMHSIVHSWTKVVSLSVHWQLKTFSQNSHKCSRKMFMFIKPPHFPNFTPSICLLMLEEKYQIMVNDINCWWRRIPSSLEIINGRTFYKLLFAFGKERRRSQKYSARSFETFIKVRDDRRTTIVTWTLKQKVCREEAFLSEQFISH